MRQLKPSMNDKDSIHWVYVTGPRNVVTLQYVGDVPLHVEIALMQLK